MDSPESGLSRTSVRDFYARILELDEADAPQRRKIENDIGIVARHHEHLREDPPKKKKERPTIPSAWASLIFPDDRELERFTRLCRAEFNEFVKLYEDVALIYDASHPRNKQMNHVEELAGLLIILGHGKPR